MPIFRRPNLEPEHWMVLAAYLGKFADDRKTPDCFHVFFPTASRLKKSTRRSINTGSLAMTSAIGSKSPVNEGKAPASKANYRPASR